MESRPDAAHLDGGSVQFGERPRQDRRREPARGERPQQERVTALEYEMERLTGRGEPLVERMREGRSTAGRHDGRLSEVGDGDMRSAWSLVGREGGDDLVPAQRLDSEPRRS